MDTYQKAYADYLRDRVSKGLDLHPDGCIAFVAGYKAAEANIIASLEEYALINEDDGCFFRGKQGRYSRTYGEALRYAVDVVKGETP